ncbi:kappa-type opioid receptor-like [Antedon mediterranea]|uniref:kappa-type opioid receptor-like n=1 Tax=Antedon mediterranea TaxID=105859 RepID=UPI003AF510A7
MERNSTTILSSIPMTTLTPNDDSKDTEHFALISIRYIVGLLGIFANVFVLLMFVWAKLYKKSFTHLLLLHQSAIDVIASCLFLVYYTNDAPVGTPGTVFCKTRSIFWLFAFASTYNLVIVTIERYIAVVHPTTYRERIHGKTNCRFLILPHIVGLAIAAHLAVIGQTNNEGKCVFEYYISSLASGLFIFIISWLIPSAIMVFCYTYILRGLSQRVKRSGGAESSPGRGGNALYAAQRSLTYTLLFVAIAFLLCWTPNYILYLSYTICKCFEFNSSIAHEITVILDAVNLMINPVIYAFKFNDFKITVKKFYKTYSGKCCDEDEEKKRAETVTGTSASITGNTSLSSN